MNPSAEVFLEVDATVASSRWSSDSEVCSP